MARGHAPQGPSRGCPRRLPPHESACITFYFEHHCKHPPNKCSQPSDALVVLGEKEQCKILSVGCPQLSMYAQEKNIRKQTDSLLLPRVITCGFFSPFVSVSSKLSEISMYSFYYER